MTSGSAVSSGVGGITLNGTDNSSGGYGIYVDGASSIAATGTGNVALTGAGSYWATTIVNSSSVSVVDGA